jgi:hypothetical protein
MESRVRVNLGEGVEARKVPIAHLLVTGTSAGASQVLFTVRPGVAFRVQRLAVANITGSAVTFSLNSVPPGGSIGDGNAELRAVSIPANTAADVTDVIGGLYPAGTVLRAYAGTGSALVAHGWGEEVL